MSSDLLVRYLRMAIAEARDARVPQQLLSADEESGDGEEDDEQSVREFSAAGAGAVAGYAAPLGMSGDDLGRKKNKRKK